MKRTIEMNLKILILAIACITIFVYLVCGIENKGYKDISLDNNKLDIKKVDNKHSYISLRGGVARGGGGRIGGAKIGGRTVGKSSSTGSTGKSSTSKSSGNTKNSGTNIKSSGTSSKTSYYDRYSPKIYKPTTWKNIDAEIDKYRNTNPFYQSYPRWTYYFNPHMGYRNLTRKINENDEWKDE